MVETWVSLRHVSLPALVLVACAAAGSASGSHAVQVSTPEASCLTIAPASGAVAIAMPREKPPGGRTVEIRSAKADSNLVKELAAKGIKHTPEEIVAIERIGDRVVFLEKGSPGAGLAHIIERHGADFARRGITEAQIPDALMSALREHRVVGFQAGRPIFEVLLDGRVQRIAITVSDNGFVVGANPAGL